MKQISSVDSFDQNICLYESNSELELEEHVNYNILDEIYRIKTN